MSGEGALVLFSGGQDSATCLAWALRRFARGGEGLAEQQFGWLVAEQQQAPGRGERDLGQQGFAAMIGIG